MLAASTIIDIVFIAIFAIIAPFSIFGAAKHSKGRRDAYVLLNLFVLVRIVGDVLLVVAAQDNSASVKTITDLFTAGFIMSNIGYGFLISACISLYVRIFLHDSPVARADLDKHETTEQRNGHR